MKKTRFQALTLFVLIISLSFFAGFRDVTVGADTRGYISYYLERLSCKCTGHHEIFFDALTIFFSFTGLTYSYYFTFISLILFLTVLYTAHLAYSSTFRILEPEANRKNEIIFISLFLSLILINPLFHQAHINALRQGLAACFLGASIFLFYQQKSFKGILALAVACGTHYSSIMYVPIILLHFFGGRRGQLFLLLFYIISSLLYLSGISEPLLRDIAPGVWSYVESYGENARDRYQTGVRLDFFFTTFFSLAVIGIAVNHMQNVEVRNRLISLNILGAALSIPFNFFGWGVFSNRYLYTTWIIISFILAIAAFPFIKKLKIGTLFSYIALPIGAFFFVSQTT